MTLPGKKYLFVLSCLIAHAGAVAADDSLPSFDFSGLAFGDLYHVPSHHLPQGDGATGAVLRRLYLTFDASFSERCSGRLRLETNQDGEFEVYEFETDFKDLYLSCQLGRHQVTGGLTSTITFDLIEKIWGARYLMRTPLDLQGVPSRDTGISVKGPINVSGNWSYRAMYGSGIEFGSDSASVDKWMGAVTWKPSEAWTFDFYADTERHSGPNDRVTLQAFAAYESEHLRWGVQYSHQDREEDPTLEVASVFAVGRIGQKMELIGRVDRLMEPSPRGNDINYLPFDPTAPATLLVGGLEIEALRNLIVTPNIVYVNYDENDQGFTPKSDLYLRLTLFVKF